MADCRDYKETLLGESLDSNDSSSDWEPSGQDTWSVIMILVKIPVKAVKIAKKIVFKHLTE